MKKAIAKFSDPHGYEVYVVPRDGETDEDAIKRVCEAHDVPVTAAKPVTDKRDRQGGGMDGSDAKQASLGMRAALDRTRTPSFIKPVAEGAKQPLEKSRGRDNDQLRERAADVKGAVGGTH